jgi:hypothetical protein
LFDAGFQPQQWQLMLDRNGLRALKQPPSQAPPPRRGRTNMRLSSRYIPRRLEKPAIPILSIRLELTADRRPP